MRKLKSWWIAGALLTLVSCQKKEIAIIIPSDTSSRIEYASQLLVEALERYDYDPTFVKDVSNQGDSTQQEILSIALMQASDTTGLKKEGFTLVSNNNRIQVVGNDGTGVIYGALELIDRLEANEGELQLPSTFSDAPEMVLRGGCVGIQKMEYLPGRGVYEYPYTPENFPWFYDKAQWIDYLDMLVKNRMNSLYLWNGHPFASLVRLKDYPFAVEVDDETFKKNEEMFTSASTR